MTKFLGGLTGCALAALAIVPVSAHASDQVVTSTSQAISIGGATFGSNSGGAENSGGGSTAITDDRAYPTSGDTGSLKVTGDRSRYVIGSLYGTTASTGFNLSSLSSFTFDWNVDQSTAAQPHGAPVGRVIVADAGGARTELIWEHVYNGGASGVTVPTDQWQNAGANSLWYANLRSPGGSVLDTFKANSQADTTGFNIIGGNGTGPGVLGNNGSQINQSLSSWTQYFSPDAKVVGFSFGAGSGFGAGFTGYVDNAVITTSAGVDRLNFDVATAAAVPEPATWAMMIGGFGLVGGAMRRRRQVRYAAA